MRPVQPERPAVLAEPWSAPPIMAPPPAPPATHPVWDWFPGPTWLVAIAGLLLGAVVARLAFGALHNEGSGLGMGEVAVVGVVIGLVARRLLRRRLKLPARVAPAGAGPAREEPPPAPPTDFARGIHAIRRADRGFDPASFAGYAGMMFRDVEIARVARDAGPLRDRLTPEMYAELRAVCERLRAAGRSVCVAEVDVGAEVTEAWQDGDQDYVTACITGSILSHTLDEATGTVVAGSPTTSSAVHAFLTFTRPAGLNFWMLSIVQA